MPEVSRARFDAATASALRLRNSVAAEVALVVVVYVVGLIHLPHYGVLSVPTWYATPGAGGRELSAAGRWFVYVSRGGASDEPLLGSADVQSLADLGTSFEVVRRMRTVPVSRDTVLQFAVITLLPVAPLLLTMVSAEELLKRLLQIVF